MDPEATLKSAREFLLEGDHEECSEILSSYAQWRHRDGFEPSMAINLWKMGNIPGDVYFNNIVDNFPLHTGRPYDGLRLPVRAEAGN